MSLKTLEVLGGLRGGVESHRVELVVVMVLLLLLLLQVSAPKLSTDCDERVDWREPALLAGCWW